MTYRTANLQSCILYIYSTNIGTEYFKHGIYSTYLFPVLFTFYIQGTLKLKNNSGAKRLTRFPHSVDDFSRGQLKCDGTRAETRFRLSAKQTSPFKSARGEGGRASVQSTTGSRGVRVRGSNAGYTTFRGSVKGTGYPLHSPVSHSITLPCIIVCHNISTGLYLKTD